MPMIFKGHNDGENPMDLVATHQRSLVAAVMNTEGPILELGVGWYSTPLLHELAKGLKRTLITIDNNKDWLVQFLPLQSEGHYFKLVGFWGEAWNFLAHPRYGVVFVDQSQPIEREYSIRALINKADVFVLHDTEEEFAYGYSRTLPMFKYQWTDKCQKSWTTIASNKIDIMKWGMIELPSVEPSTEVT